MNVPHNIFIFIGKPWFTSILFFLTFFTCFLVSGQEQVLAHYTAFDAAFGLEKSGLYNGTEYREQPKGANGKHKFWKSDEFKFGQVIYNGQPYAKVPLKYDVLNDELLLDLGNRFGVNILQLNKDLIANFKIENTYFINSSNIPKNGELSGFLEVFYDTQKFTLYKKHNKQKKEGIREKVSYVEYEDLATYILELEDKYYQIDSKRDLIHLFPEYEKEIKNSVRGLKRKSDETLYMLRMVQAIAPSKNLMEK